MADRALSLPPRTIIGIGLGVAGTIRAGTERPELSLLIGDGAQARYVIITLDSKELGHDGAWRVFKQQKSAPLRCPGIPLWLYRDQVIISNIELPEGRIAELIKAAVDRHMGRTSAPPTAAPPPPRTNMNRYLIAGMSEAGREASPRRGDSQPWKLSDLPKPINQRAAPATAVPPPRIAAPPFGTTAQANRPPKGRRYPCNICHTSLPRSELVYQPVYKGFHGRPRGSSVLMCRNCAGETEKYNEQERDQQILLVAVAVVIVIIIGIVRLASTH